jgi:hypothetical protein
VERQFDGENTIFGTDSQSFMGNADGVLGVKWKAVRSVMSKSFIGRVIISVYSNSYHLSVEGGRGLVVSGVQFDASPDPVKIGWNGYAGYAEVVRGNANASDPGVKV